MSASIIELFRLDIIEQPDSLSIPPRPLPPVPLPPPPPSWWDCAIVGAVCAIAGLLAGFCVSAWVML